MKIQTKLTIFLSVIFLSVLTNTLFTFQLEKFSQEKSDSVFHTHQAIILTNQFLSYVQDAETGQRGYLLTRDLKYLEPYHTGKIKAYKSINELIDLTKDNENQTVRLKKIKLLLDEKINELAVTIDLTGKDKFAQALVIVKQDQGKKFMDEIRLLIDEVMSVENALLVVRKGDFIENKTRITTLIAVEITFFVLAAIFTFSFLRRSLFEPINLLLMNTKKVEEGKRIQISDLIAQDEMGYLLSSFYNMQEKIADRANELTHLAHHDDLTQLPNRIKVYESINKAIKEAKAFDKNVALLFIDLNKFKQINDTLGHEAGDCLLREAANRFKRVVRDEDVVFRLGGDEFLILLANVKGNEQVKEIIAKIFKSINSPVEYQGKAINISASIGVASFPQNGETPEILMKAADTAMYAAKKDKDSDVQFFEDFMLKG